MAKVQVEVDLFKGFAEETKLWDDVTDESGNDGSDVKSDLQLNRPPARGRIFDGRFGSVDLM